MTKFLLPCAILCTVLPAFAQNCNVAPAARTIATLDPFQASFYGGQSVPVPAGYTGMGELTDMVLSAPVTITAMTKTTYDQGQGGGTAPPPPNQVGNTTTVNIYTCPTGWGGNQMILPSAPASPWTLRGTATLTIVAWPASSPMVLTSPITLPAGSYGLMLETTPTTTGLNPGPLHSLYSTTTLVSSDQFITLQNQAHQGQAFVSGLAIGNINLTITYTAAAPSGHSVPFGSGCYFNPQAFYEDRPASTSPVPLANTSMQWFNLGNRYLVTSPTPPLTIVPPTSPNLTAGAFGASSSASWDDALTTPITLPFTFNYPSGSTSTITISSNGCIYLAAVTGATFQDCGAMYNVLSVLRDKPARLCPFWCDLDMDLASTSGGGTLHYEVDPAATPQWVRISWMNVPEWPTGPTGTLNTMQLTLHVSGNVDIAYGTLANVSVANLNDAITGWTPGNGANLPAPIANIAAAIPFQGGDGSVPPILSLSARPVIGTTTSFVTSNLTPGTLFVFLVMGFGHTGANGIDLSSIGMPNCRQYIQPFTSVLLPVVGGTASAPLGIPNNASYQNVMVFGQSAPITAGLNAAGILTSNGLCVRAGQ